LRRTQLHIELGRADLERECRRSDFEIQNWLVERNAQRGRFQLDTEIRAVDLHIDVHESQSYHVYQVKRIENCASVVFPLAAN
jgi:hypothetical protein